MKIKIFTLALVALIFGGSNSFAASKESQYTVGLVVTECRHMLDFMNTSQMKQAEKDAFNKFKEELSYATNACSWDPKAHRPIRVGLKEQNFRADLCASKIKPLMCGAVKKAGELCCAEVTVANGSKTELKNAPIEKSVQGRDSAVKDELKKTLKRIKAYNKTQGKAASS